MKNGMRYDAPLLQPQKPNHALIVTGISQDM